MATISTTGLNPRRSERGQSAIESVLIILPLFAVLCAIIDFSMALFIRNSLVSAVREGTRYAVTGQTGAGGSACQDASIKSIVQNNAMGLLAGSAGAAKINIQYFDENLGDVSAAANSNAGGHIVRVSVSGVSWLWMLSGLWENANGLKPGASTHYTGLTIGAASSDIVEPPPNGVAPCR
jgi:Flp pilus assembly protein TadG